jgi:hypothetical protein
VAACARHRARGNSSWPLGPLARLISMPLAQTIGTDLGDTGANFDDLLSGDGTLADEPQSSMAR